MTVRTFGLACITSQHDAILYLVTPFTKVVEEKVDADIMTHPTFFKRETTMTPVPQEVALLVGQLVIRFENREANALGHTDELGLPLVHFLPTPTLDTALIDALGRIGDDQMWVDTGDVAPTLAGRTSTHRRVESEELVGRFLEGNAIGLESRGERVLDACRQEA